MEKQAQAIEQQNDEYEKARQENEELRQQQQAYEDLREFGYARDPHNATVLRPITVEDVERFDKEKAAELRAQGIQPGGEEPPITDDTAFRPSDFKLNETDMAKVRDDNH